MYGVYGGCREARIVRSEAERLGAAGRSRGLRTVSRAARRSCTRHAMDLAIGIVLAERVRGAPIRWCGCSNGFFG